MNFTSKSEFFVYGTETNQMEIINFYFNRIVVIFFAILSVISNLFVMFVFAT
jgi:hypothetical protein